MPSWSVGISGGWAAKELTEKGLRVLLLERGKNIEHIKDYVIATKAPWDYPHRGRRTKAMEAAYPVLKRDYPLNETNLIGGSRPGVAVYRVKRFDWYRGLPCGRPLADVGAPKAIAGATSTFEANARDGIAIDWPISIRRYRALVRSRRTPRRDRRLARRAWPNFRTEQFQPAMPLNCGEELIAGRLKQHFEGRRRIIPGRTANLTQALPDAPLSVSQRVLAGLPIRRVLQLAILDAAGGRGHRTADAQAFRDRHPRFCTIATRSARRISLSPRC